MIHGVYANQSTFRSVHFEPGLNVIVAERSDTSSERDTRNGVGKSTLIQIVDFCLGASAVKGKGLCIKPLEGWAFTIDMTLAGNRVKVTRSLDKANRIVVDGPTNGWVLQPERDESSGELFFSLACWKNVLGAALFGLAQSYNGMKYVPSYRSLVSYFVRRGSDAYLDPFRHFRQQATWDIQLHVAFLLQLGWQYPSRLQELRDQDQALNALDMAVKAGVLEGQLGTVGELEAERVQLESQATQENEALRSFRVHPQYEHIQAEADRITESIHQLANRNVVDRRTLRRYQEAVNSETPPSDEALETLYADAGIVFPDTLRRTLEEARHFHQQIIHNRRAFLAAETARLERQIADRESQIRELTNSRADFLDILKTHGAIQELTHFQEQHLQTKEKLVHVVKMIAEIKNISAKKRDVKVAKAELAKALERDHEERRPKWTRAVQYFNDNSMALYESPGKLVIDITDSGYKYDVEIERSDSEGIGKMKIFCFDLMLSQLARATGNGMDVLIHDSLIFDGVDSRQRALALEQAASVMARDGGQYICTFNSDMIPRDDFQKAFNFDSYVRLTLTDRDPSESLLGKRF